ncbi:hypothetical protein GCK32_016882 [Trichostrongylus colubriformis]|uniref:Uncharacterized protein n=1 Tax=Trichostrongylus colubriformis TaxID=6319 RepID=A0AAN8G2H7_TRICO
MMFFVVLYLLVQAQAYQRNQATWMPDGPLDRYDLLDDLTRFMFGYNVATLQQIYSHGKIKAEEYLKSNGGLQHFSERGIRWPLDTKQRESYRKFYNILLRLALRMMSRSAARAALIQDYLALPEDLQREMIIEYPGFAFIKIMVNFFTYVPYQNYG